MAARRMGLKHVEAFRAVFVTGSMTQAAQRMHTSQPQISRLIGQLEAITQFPLFDRSGGRLRPTVDGSRFFQEVEKTDWSNGGTYFAKLASGATCSATQATTTLTNTAPTIAGTSASATTAGVWAQAW